MLTMDNGGADMSAKEHRVLIAGAGPTGLLLAGDLARAGVAVTVLERRTDTSNLTRAFAVHARTLEEFDARGLADELIAAGRPVRSLRAFGAVEVNMSRLPTRFPYVLITPQYETERVLEQRARALGAEIVHGAEVTGLRQDDGGVDVDVRSPDGEPHTRRAAYLVGADGVRSAVRRALGLPFPGHSAVRSMMLADVRLADPPEGVLTANGVAAGFAFIAPFGDGWYRVIAWNRHRELPDDAPVDLAEIREITRAALGTDHGMHDPRWLSRFHSDERQVPHYRAGRVFLAGDAAHVHSPAGGMGMNTGLQDAANLGWKLAAVLHGRAPESLLDSYEAERHPVGRMVLRGSGAILRMALLGPRPLRALRDLVGPAVSKIGPISRRVAGGVSGVAIAYPAPGFMGRDAHPLVGKRAPDVPLTGDGPSRLYEALRSGRFVLVTRDGAATGRDALPAGWTDTIDVVTSAAGFAADAPTALVRPDGYVAWATKDADTSAGLAELAAAAAGGRLDAIAGNFT
jgi:2-polyprenyl-6-methoxyphenol hydroxylase-like FAD-dependent oxidoreductase